MLTIGQLASYAGVTVRAVRHYHSTGLLPEPERDPSGYRSYGAHDVAELVKIRTLAQAGVPLARVRRLLAADSDEFAAAVAEIDQRLRAEIRAGQRHRRRVAQLAAGDSLALPPEAVSYLQGMRDLGFTERFVAGERDAWILVAAQLPEQMAHYMKLKRQQLTMPANLDFLHRLAGVVEGDADEAALAGVADTLAGLLDTAEAAGELTEDSLDDGFSDNLVQLLDSMFLEMVPAAPRLLALLRERGWSGWTRFERIEASTPPSGATLPASGADPA